MHHQQVWSQTRRRTLSGTSSPLASTSQIGQRKSHASKEQKPSFLPFLIFLLSQQVSIDQTNTTQGMLYFLRPWLVNRNQWLKIIKYRNIVREKVSSV